MFSEQTVLKPQSTKLIQPPMRFGSTSQKPLPLAQKPAAPTQNVPAKRVSTAPASAIDAEHSRYVFGRFRLLCYFQMT